MYVEMERIYSVEFQFFFTAVLFRLFFSSLLLCVFFLFIFLFSVEREAKLQLM